ncbi:Vesicular glutamate transporter 2.1 [Stylophora pistillata]|uniref:Vesicular glutamate transporter 2.1 n=1 Tax=Stylophora pistillata TaxID=50429 RepID=A0A2B4RZC3_STYPI|nr:Vesicular glutamate transporter 2.1 [Stylophora pistillata]
MALVQASNRFLEPEFKTANFAKAINDQKLDGSVLRDFEVASEISCLFECISEDRCFSYNFLPIDGKAANRCQLSGSDRFVSYGNFIKEDGALYRGIQSTCEKDDPCKENETCVVDYKLDTHFYCPKNCLDYYQNGSTTDGVYWIYPDEEEPFQVLCDMTTDGGGWTTFQRRMDGSVDFYVDWESYKKGFGNLKGEFWLGNDFLHRLTASANMMFRIDMEDYKGDRRFAEYTTFSVADESNYYRLTIAGYRGTAGDSLLSLTKPIRVNLNVAIGAMVNNHTAVVDGETICREAEFKWKPELKGVILGAFYYGYMVFQIPGGWLALRVGGARLFGAAVMIASLFTLLTPMATRWSSFSLIILRVLEGLVLGVLFPCNHAMWSRWAPSAERTTLVTVSITGASIGYLLTMPITGLLTKYGFDGGWASVFYCFGVFGIVWYIVWLMVAYESPTLHPTISDDERCLIQETALDLSKMGFMAAAPFLVKGVCSPLSGLAADMLRRSTVSTKNVRRFFYAAGAVASGFLVLIAGYSLNVTVIVICMSLAGLTTSLAFPAYTVNMLDIAPRYSSIIMGVCNTVGTTAGFVSPTIVGFITQDKTAEEWQRVFWLTFVILLGGTFLFCLLMSGERQDWDQTVNKPTDGDTESGSAAGS